jgi:hypothetical protein
MTGVELQKYLMSSGLFKDENVYMVEIIDGEIYNRVPSYYKMFIPMLGKLEIRIYYNKHGDKIKWVDFNFCGLYASHKLKDLDIKTLISELNRIIGSDKRFSDKRFIEWSTKELRDYKINSLYE